MTLEEVMLFAFKQMMKDCGEQFDSVGGGLHQRMLGLAGLSPDSLQPGMGERAAG